MDKRVQRYYFFSEKCFFFRKKSYLCNRKRIRMLQYIKKNILYKSPVLWLCLGVMMISIIVMSVIFAISYRSANKRILDDAIIRAQLNVDKSKEIVERHLTEVSVSAQSLASTRLKNYRDKEQVYDLLERFLKANPHVWGAAVGYEEGVFPGKRFAPFVRHADNEYVRYDLTTEDSRDNFKADWYKTTMEKDCNRWSKPFHDLRGSLIACYCIPLHDADGKKIGVLAVDLQLDRFTDELMNEVRPYPNSACMVLDQDQEFIAHPNHELIMTSLKDFVHKTTTEKGYNDNESIMIRIQNEVSGYDTFAEGTRYEGMMFYAPILSANWTVALAVTKEDIFADNEVLARKMFNISLLGVLLMVLCSGLVFWQIRKVVTSKASIESELNVAASIQMGMLPKLYPAFPEVNELDVYGFLKPAKEVGGDLFDYFIRNNKFYFCIGDVSGKGVPASLFMAVLRSLFRNVSLHSESPANIATALNTALAEGNEQNMFCTMFIGILDLENGQLKYCNAGHNAPIVREIVDGKANVKYTKPETNIAVGIFEGFPYIEEQVTMAPGEAIFLYTDGVTEAEDINKTLYGEEQLLADLHKAREANSRSAKDFVDYIYSCVSAHAHGAYQSDDITMVVVEYKG